MPGSGAGSNYVSAYILQNVSAPTAVATNAQGLTTAYGTIGVNDSGGWLGEARNFTKWTFSLEQIGSTALSGFSISLYGVNGPNAEQSWWNALFGGPYAGSYNASGAAPSVNGITNAAGYVPGIAPLAWFLLPGPSEQSGTGSIANPIIAGSGPTLFTASLRLAMVRAVVTTSATPTGQFNLSCAAVP